MIVNINPKFEMSTFIVTFLIAIHFLTINVIYADFVKNM